ncbi:hypothetical protein [Streptomyces sp. NPDC090021]|uniref:hypothetical protein n=1 Tax=Streptomyces sp. NPDC090021 TaxID=3365919 RepID=UPI003806B2D4
MGGSKAVVAELDLATGTEEPKGLDAGVRVLYLTGVKAIPEGCSITQTMTSSCGITRSSTKMSPLSGARVTPRIPWAMRIVRMCGTLACFSDFG